MKNTPVVSRVALMFFIGAVVVLQPAARRIAAQATPDTDLAAASRATVQRYCVSCHSDRGRAAGMPDLALNTMDWSRMAESSATWEKVARKLRAGSMPPPGRPRPDRDSYSALLAYVEGELDRAAAARPNPGRTEALHRLNRTEYQNAIRDLLAVSLNVGSTLPTDDASYGFDNIASSLRISPAALDQYMSAARRVSRAALGVAPSAPVAEDFFLPADARQYRPRRTFAVRDPRGHIGTTFFPAVRRVRNRSTTDVRCQ